MSKLNIYPQSGLSSTKSLLFELDSIQNKTGVRISFEDATHLKKITINSNDFLLLAAGETRTKGMLELDIPSHSAQSVISLFATVEEKRGNEYVKTSMHSAVFNIEDKPDKSFEGNINIYPIFASPDNKVVIKLKSEPNARIVSSINDRHFGILTDRNGNGSISFLAKDVLTSTRIGVMQKFLIKLFLKDSNYTQPVSSGQYLYVLPAKIALHADSPNCEVEQVPGVALDELVDDPPGLDVLPSPEIRVYSAPYFEVHPNVDILIGKSIESDVKKIVG